MLKTETLTQNLDRHTKKSPDGGKEWNTLIGERHVKDQEKVIERLIDNLKAKYPIAPEDLLKQLPTPS